MLLLQTDRMTSVCFHNNTLMSDLWPHDLETLPTKMVYFIFFIHMTGAELAEIFGLSKL